MTEFEAEQGKNLLQANGIDAFLEGASSQTMLSYIGVAVGGVKLLVQERDSQRATEILDAQVQKAGGPWTCPNCYCEVDAGFDLCWRCGTVRHAEPSDSQEAGLPWNSSMTNTTAAQVPDVQPQDGRAQGAQPQSGLVQGGPVQGEPSPGGRVRSYPLAPAGQRRAAAGNREGSHDELVDRAWRAAVFGIVILPGILHLYSLMLLIAASLTPSPAGLSLRMFVTFIIDLACITLIAALFIQAFT